MIKIDRFGKIVNFGKILPKYEFLNIVDFKRKNKRVSFESHARFLVHWNEF